MTVRAGAALAPLCVIMLCGGACGGSTSDPGRAMRPGSTAPSAVDSWSTTQAEAPLVPFPPRNEPFDFRNQLERKYRDGLGRAPVATFVDLEGAIVWIQEYMRYRVNGCAHIEATQNVLDQIDGRAIAPACSDVAPGTIAFPPRNEPFEFRNELERKYRDSLRRPATTSSVDIEGEIVWVQEYLRYRINSCGHETAVTKVMEQIDGQGIRPICRDAADLTGFWIGSSTYFNAPFSMDLRQTGTTVRGTYQDQHDRGSIFADVPASGSLVLDVNFGDTGIRFTGARDGFNRITGTITGTVIGGAFPFEMVR